ncbi:MAG: anaerobic ribonucleoside-triphosphate reductase activating protein [Candidatus Korarchaeota archaeon NZ13-K]|nr:MAG: anaerobic ribonucleoside-triphosphate reductase activating protein [Candidatus Korarchaeota archaeon NZ13-K]
MMGSGWRPLSTVDVRGAVTFTLWLCGCNLRCPFCHNHSLASLDPLKCRVLDLNELMEDLLPSSGLIDYFHVTGGEPLLQWRPLSDLLREVASQGVRVSLNTNLTLPSRLQDLLSRVEVNHLATDLKIPPHELYGLPESEAWGRWEDFLLGLRMASRSVERLEVRVPVARSLSVDELRRYAGEALSRIDCDYEIVVHPLLGPPLTDPRDEDWCRLNCDPDGELLQEVLEVLTEISGRRVFLRGCSIAPRPFHQGGPDRAQCSPSSGP